MRWSLAALFLLTVTVVGQSPAGEPAFDVVSIKRNTTTGPGGFPVAGRPIESPSGAIRLTAVPAMTLLMRAYGVAGNNIVGLPEWARREYYDVSATSTLPQATADERAAMMRAMLVDRFKLVAHIEMREQSVLALTLSRKDGQLGAGLTQIAADCVAKRAADQAAAATGSPAPPPPRPTGPDFVPPPCTLVSVADRAGVTWVKGEGTMADLAGLLRLPMQRQVIDQTGLPGSYRIEMTYQMAQMAPQLGGLDPSPAAGPDISTALSELGLKVESREVELDTLIVDRIERPTED